MMGAFENTAARSHALALVEQEAPSVLTAPQGPTLENAQALADETGLAPNFIALLQALGWNDKPFLSRTLNQVQAGSDTALLPGQWLQTLWVEFGHLITEPGEREAAGNVLELHRYVAAGKVVQRVEWRKARAAFSPSNNIVSTAAASIIAATAWDPLATHGAFADAVLQLPELARSQWDVEAGWIEADDDWARELDDLAITHGREQAGPVANEAREWYESEEGEAWVERFMAGYQAYMQENGQRIRDRNQCISQARHALMETAKSALLRVISGKTQA